MLNSHDMPAERLRAKMRSFLSNVPVFNSMRPEELDRIALGTTEIRASKGDIVFHRGEPCVGFHVVLYGLVKLSFIAASGAEKVMELIGPGHTFGEALMFMEKDYIVSAQAVEDSLLLHVGKQTIFREIHDDPAFSRKLLAGLSQRMHGLMCDMESYTLRSGTQRVAGYLSQQHSTEGGDVIRLGVSKAMLASRLNLTPEHFSRIMAELSAQQVIAFRGRTVNILDAGGLQRIAGLE
ncbi:MAG: Crp/Fnr family transcriptional regulator [Duganella sp.]